MLEDKSWEKITEIGRRIQKGWQMIADDHCVGIRVTGIPALSAFNICGPSEREYKTLITQEMLKKGYLAGNSVYACTHHDNETVEGYLSRLDEIFGVIKKCEDGLDVRTLLEGPVCHGGFKRLN